jgi:hypothetical protein
MVIIGIDADKAQNLLLVLFLSLLSVPAAAQTEPDPASTARMHLGPLALTPAIALQNIGIDSNVFNEAENPQQDFTATLRPQFDAWLRLGRGRLSLDGAVEAVHFKRFSSERSVNVDGSATFDFRWNRVSAFGGGDFLTTRQRPGFEIDTRSRRVEGSLRVGSGVRLSGKTALGVRAERRAIDFDVNAEIFGTSLSEALNRHEDVVTAFLEHNLTTLTTLVLNADIQRDTFDFSRARDSRSIRITPGVRFKPSALVSGSASVGFRRFDALDSSVPPFDVTYASIDLAYTLRGRTRFSVQSERDVEYSFESSQPYYLGTGVTGSIVQALTTSWSVSARGGTQRLDYRGSADTAVGQLPRLDRIHVYGAGILYRLSPAVLVGVSADYYRRRAAELRQRDYESLRVGSFFTLGVRGQ